MNAPFQFFFSLSLSLYHGQEICETSIYAAHCAKHGSEDPTAWWMQALVGRT